MTSTSDDAVAALVLELDNLGAYFSRLLGVAVRENDYKKIDECFKIIENLANGARTIASNNYSFADVFVIEFEESAREMIDKIKEASNNFSSLIQYDFVVKHIFELNLKLANNVFANETFEIDNKSSKTFTCLPIELANYLKIGSELKDEDATRKLKEELALLKDRNAGSNSIEDSSYYAAIIGPSFMGKTQTAFTLSHLMNVMYVNLLSTVPRTGESGSQPIYEEFLDFSKLFSITIDEDLKIPDAISASSIYRHSARFHTLGLLYCLIRRKVLNANETTEQNFLAILNIKKAFIPKITPSQFRSKMLGNSI